MRKIVVYELLSLDGVAEAPDTFFGWDDALDANLAAVIGDTGRGHPRPPELRRVGRSSGPAARSSRSRRSSTGSRSTSRHRRRWTGTGPRDAIEGGLVEFVRDLRQQPGGDIGVHASISVAQALLAADVVDELKLVVAPRIVGDGRRLLDGLPSIRLELIRSGSSPAGYLPVDYRVIQ